MKKHYPTVFDIFGEDFRIQETGRILLPSKYGIGFMIIDSIPTIILTLSNNDGSVCLQAKGETYTSSLKKLLNDLDTPTDFYLTLKAAKVPQNVRHFLYQMWEVSSERESCDE